MRILFLVLLFVLSGPLAWGAPGLPLDPEEQAYLKEHPVVKVGVDRNWPPFDYFDPVEGHQGIASNYLAEVARRLGLSVEYYPTDWNKVLELSKTNAVDMLACAVRTPQREDHLLFSDPYISVDLAVFVPKQNDFIRTLADLNGKTVSLPQGNFVQDFLQSNYPDIRLHVTRSNEEAIDLVALGKVDAYVGNSAVGSYFLEKNIITNVKIAFKLPDKKSGLGFAVNKNNPVLFRLVQKALADIDDDTRQDIRRQWVRYFSEDHSPIIALSEPEKEWIRQHRIIKVGTGNDWPPYDFRKNGTYQGIANDFLELISRKAGLRFDCSVTDTWAGLQQQLATGKIDLLPAIYYDKRHVKKFLFSNVYTVAKEFMFVREDNHEILNLDDTKGKTAVFVTGSDTMIEMRRRFPWVRIVEVDTIQSALQLLINGKADFYIDTFGAVSHVANELGLDGIKAAFPVDLVDTGLRMAVNKDNPLLFSILQKGLEAVTLEEKDRIERQWLGSSADSRHKRVELNDAERAWIKAHPEIIIAGDPNREPVSFFTRDDRYVGIIADYLRLIRERTGLRFTPRHFNSFADAVEALREQKIDMLDAVGYSFEHSSFIDYSHQHIQVDNVIVVRDKGPGISRVTELAGYSVGVVEGYIVGDKIKADVPEVKLHAFADAETGLKQVSQGKLDAFIVDLPTLDYISEKLGLSNLKVSGGTPYSFPLHFGLTKNEPLLGSIINKALDSIDLAERRDIYRDWVHFDYQATIDYTLLGQIAGVLLLIIAATLYWNRRLSLEIRKRILVEKELSRLHRSLEFTPVMVLMTDARGMIEYANNAFYRITGYGQQETIGRHINRFACRVNEKALYRNLWRDIRQGKTWQAELRYEKKSRELFWISMVVTPVVEDETTATGFIWLCEDITIRKAAEQQLVLAKDAAEQATRAKSEFLANMSHEIRTPMNSVIGFTDLLDELINDPLQKSYLRSIKVGGKALLSIINDILDLSKIEAGQLKLTCESINPHILFAEMEQLFHARIRQKNLQFRIEVDSEIPEYLILDGVRLRQILFNLIGNAIKFTEHGGITLGVKKIYKDVQKSKLDLEIRVADSGMGIPEADLERIFGVFEQQTGQDARRFGGTGLGLSICKKLVNMMNGGITVTSKVGQGSEFTVRLHDVDVSSVKAVTTPDLPSETAIEFEPATVMVADDVPDNRALVKASFAGTAVKVIEAVHGQDAIDRLHAEKVDLILMDLRMPVMNGYEAVKIIRQEEVFHDLPIVALTASVLGNDLQRIKEFGFDGYIQKPVEKKRLLQEVSRYILCRPAATGADSPPERVRIDSAVTRDAIVVRMESDLFEEWKEVRDKGDIQLIQKFSENLAKLAAEQDFAYLRHYTERLSVSVLNFDLTEITDLMIQYPDLVQIIKNAEVKANV